MAPTHELHLHNDRGDRLAILTCPLISFETVRSVNTIGTLKFSMPFGTVPSNWLQQDYGVLIMRSTPGGTMAILHETLYLIQKVRHRNEAGKRVTTVECVDANDLLRGRIIAYYAQSSQAAKSAIAADNMLKDFIQENLSSTASDYASSTSRGLAAGTLAVQADLTLAPTRSKNCAWRNLYDILREVCNDSRTQGTYLAFDIVVKPGLGLEFRTYTGQRGIDRRSGTNAVILSEAAGTLINAELTMDYTQVCTTIYAGGRGEESARIIQTASDTTRIRTNKSRREDFIQAFQGETAAYVLGEAQAELANRRPKLSFSAEFQETPTVRYGVDVGFGDYVRCDEFGYLLDCRMDTVSLAVDEEGRERLDVALRSETLL